MKFPALRTDHSESPYRLSAQDVVPEKQLYLTLVFTELRLTSTRPLIAYGKARQGPCQSETAR